MLFLKPLTMINKIQQTPLDAETDSAIRISPRSLIALSRAAESLPLSAIGIRALQSGHYTSPFKGRGMEFDEVRPYQPGDDIRSLDWKVTARTGKAHTKLFREERERPVLLFTDLRRSMFFATRGAFKAVISARLSALLAWSACSHGDRLGGLIFSDQQHCEIRPRRGKSAVLHFIKTLCNDPVWHQSGNADQASHALQHALGRLRRVARPGSLVFLNSDFKSLDKHSEPQLAQLAQHCDLVLLHISDPLERELPANGWFRLNDGRREINLNTYDTTLRQNHAARFAEHETYLKHLCTRYGMYYLTVSTHEDIVKRLQFGLGLKRGQV